MKTIFLWPFFSLIAFALELSANQMRPMSPQEMYEKSEFVADGRISTVEIILTENIAHPDGHPLVSKKYRARFRVETLLKGHLETTKGENDILTIEYWHTDDLRFKGDNVPELKIGDAFRLFTGKPSLNESGDSVTLLNNTNQVRAEAFGVEVKQGELKEKKESPIAQFTAPPSTTTPTPKITTTAKPIEPKISNPIPPQLPKSFFTKWILMILGILTLASVLFLTSRKR